VWILQVLSIQQGNIPELAKSHSAAACGSFKSFLLRRASNLELAKSHSAAACGSFKSFLRTAYLTLSSRIPQRGSVWIVQVLSTPRASNLELAKSHSAAACGFVQVRPTKICYFPSGALSAGEMTAGQQ